MSRSFHRWLASLDRDTFEVAAEGGIWAGTVAAGLVVIAVAGLIPTTRDFFGLDAPAALACFVPTLVVNGAFRLQVRAGRATFESYGVGLWLTALFMVFFAGSLVALSKPQGATVMAAILLVVATTYGNLLRASFENPISLIPVVVGLGGSTMLGLDGDHLLIFSVAGPAALGAHVAMGNVALETQRRRDQHERVKAAVQAQVLDERGRDVSRLNDAILRILQNNHDASNALSTALLNAQMLVQNLDDLGDDDGAERFKDLSGDLLDSLLRLRSLVDETRAVGFESHENGGAIHEVPLRPTVERVAAAVARQHPSVELHVDVEDGLRVQTSGGEEVLHRIVENLLLNACEGDGQRGADRVWVDVVPGEPGTARLRVSDDGPGFEEAQLAEPVQAFATTKPTGSGVGLYVVERLVRASRATLSRAARPGGGARVEVAFRARRSGA
jgi:signal transduction histidine kinase